MKKLSVLALAAIALAAGAQNKIDFPGRMVIEQMRMHQDGSINDETHLAPMSYAAEQRYGVLVDFGDNDIDFGGLDIEEIARVGNIAVVSVTTDEMEAIAALPQVLSVQLGYEKTPLMYKARPAGSVDQVQTGKDLSRKYTGKGVICGLYDTGLDVNHINFLNADGTPRTQRLWVYNGGSVGTAYDTPTKISNYTTETDTESHGTHVLGIMAGSYNGPAKYAYLANGSQRKVVEQNEAGSAIPFYGIATESDLAVACGTLSDASIVAGVTNIFNYAKSQGKPAVANLSIGSTLGPHDGTDATAKALATLGKSGIICIAAGNEGDQNISITAYGESIKTLMANGSTSSAANGMVEFWASDNQVFTLRFFGYSNRQEVFSYTLNTNLAGRSVSKADMPNFDKAFTSSSRATISSNINTANNRYSVSLVLSLTPLSGVYAGVEIIPVSSSQVVNGYANSDGILFMSRSEAGFSNGSPANSINDMACGENIVVVGSFVSAPTWNTLTNTSYSYGSGVNEGGISSFSSYGTLLDGRKLPNVCAPGQGISSSYNQYYVNKGYADAPYLTGQYTTTQTGLMARNSTWGIMQGTSMASPFVAGVVALWLEAAPTLTCAEVLDVIAKKSDSQLSNTRWGAGKINAYEGIKYVLDKYASVTDVNIDTPDALIQANGREYEVFVPGAQRVEVALYNLSGMRVMNAVAEGNTATLSAADVAAGVYVLRVESDKGTESHKVAIR